MTPVWAKFGSHHAQRRAPLPAQEPVTAENSCSTVAAALSR